MSEECSQCSEFAAEVNRLEDEKSDLAVQLEKANDQIGELKDWLSEIEHLASRIVGLPQ